MDNVRSNMIKWWDPLCWKNFVGPSGTKFLHLCRCWLCWLCRWKEKYKRTASSKFVEGRKPTLSIDGERRCQDVVNVTCSTIQCVGEGLLKSYCGSPFASRKEWKQICLPWSDTWEESAAGIIRKEGISIVTRLISLVYWCHVCLITCTIFSGDGKRSLRSVEPQGHPLFDAGAPVQWQLSCGKIHCVSLWWSD